MPDVVKATANTQTFLRSHKGRVQLLCGYFNSCASFHINIYPKKVSDRENLHTISTALHGAIILSAWGLAEA